MCSRIAKVTEISKRSSSPLCSQAAHAAFSLSGETPSSPEGLSGVFPQLVTGSGQTAETRVSRNKGRQRAVPLLERFVERSAESRDEHWSRRELRTLSTADVLFSNALWHPIQNQKAPIPAVPLKLANPLLADSDRCSWTIKTGLRVTELQQRGHYLVCLVPSCATGFKVFSTCFWCFLQKFLKDGTNHIIWTFPLPWFMKLKLLSRRSNSRADTTTGTSQLGSATHFPYYTKPRCKPLSCAYISPHIVFHGEMTKCNFSQILPHRVFQVKRLIWTKNANSG